MSDRCELRTVIPCVACGKELSHPPGVIVFYWGQVPYTRYRLGDAVRWLTDAKGRVWPSFVVRATGPLRFNVGEPQFKDLFVFEETDAFGDPDRYCEHCGQKYEAFALWIEGGRFKALYMFRPGEVEATMGPIGGTAIVIRRSDGSYWPRLDWADWRLTVISDTAEPKWRPAR